MKNVKDEAQRNLVKEVYAPYRIDTYTSRDLPEDNTQPPKVVYALLPAGVYSILGEDTFSEIISNSEVSFTYDKDGNPVDEEVYFPGIYVGHRNEKYGAPHLDYEDPEVDGVLYKFIPISWDEFPQDAFDRATINCVSPLVENAVDIVRTYVSDIIRERCEGKSPVDLYKYVDSTFFYEFFTDVIKWARALTPAR